MKNAPTPDSVARVVRWALMIFFAYVLWHSTPTFTSKPPSPPQTLQQTTTGKNTDCTTSKSATTLQDFPLLNIPLLGAMIPTVHTEDTKPGDGAPAICGERATVHYSLALNHGNVLYDSGEARTITIGGTDILPGMTRGLLGMKPGGQRTITIPQPLAFDNPRDIAVLQGSDHYKIPSGVKLKNEIITADVSLAALAGTPPDSDMPLRYIDAMHTGTAKAECGDTVRIALTIWKMDGTKLFAAGEEKPITYTIGQGEVPYGIEQGTIGMQQRSKRTLIVPPAYLQPSDTKWAKHPQTSLIPITFAAHEMVLVEMVLLPALEEQSTPVPTETKKPTAPAKKVSPE